LFDKLDGGSFARWCAEAFDDRVEGSDFIVLVSRAPSYIKRHEWAWPVDIAEVKSVMPKCRYILLNLDAQEIMDIFALQLH
jgi:hypothetical protein